MITPWINIIAKILGLGDCILSMTDISTSEGWLRKSNFKEDGEIPYTPTLRLKISRSDTKRKMENEIKNYSQWFPGWMNDVSDSLSRYNNIGDDELINIFVPSLLHRFYVISRYYRSPKKYPMSP